VGGGGGVVGLNESAAGLGKVSLQANHGGRCVRGELWEILDPFVQSRLRSSRGSPWQEIQPVRIQNLH